MRHFLSLTVLSLVGNAAAANYSLRPNTYSGGGGFWEMHLSIDKKGAVQAEIGGARDGRLEYYNATGRVRGKHDIFLVFSPELHFRGSFVSLARSSRVS